MYWHSIMERREIKLTQSNEFRDIMSSGIFTCLPSVSRIRFSSLQASCHQCMLGIARASARHFETIESSLTLMCQSGLSVRDSMTLIMATSRTGNGRDLEPRQLPCAPIGKNGKSEALGLYSRSGNPRPGYRGFESSAVVASCRCVEVRVDDDMAR